MLSSLSIIESQRASKSPQSPRSKQRIQLTSRPLEVAQRRVRSSAANATRHILRRNLVQQTGNARSVTTELAIRDVRSKSTDTNERVRLAGVAAEGYGVLEVLVCNFGGDVGDGVGCGAGEPVVGKLLGDEERVHGCLVGWALVAEGGEELAGGTVSVVFLRRVLMVTH